MINWLNSGEWIQTLGWTLIHSIWQIVLISLALFFLLRLLRSNSPTLKYHLMISGMIASFILVIFTAIGSYQNYQKDQIPPVLTEQQTSADLTFYSDELATMTPAEQAIPFYKKIQYSISGWLDKNMTWIVLCWLTGVLIFSTRMIASLAFLSHLRFFGVHPMPEKFQQKMIRFSQQLGINRPILFGESSLVKEPLTFGFFKPVLLFPVGVLTQLEPEQAEALLLHELAHIKRYDYLVNLIQSILEILLFYHPLVWWMSRKIRQYREECCDDIAIAKGAQPVAYAGALLAIQQFIQQSKIQLTMGINGYSNGLTARINRLFSTKKSRALKDKSPSKVMVIIGFALLFMVLGAFTGIAIKTGGRVSVAADKMNVFYVGVDNPITVAVAGVPSEKVNVSSEKLNIKEVAEGKYIVHAFEEGTAYVHVKTDGKTAGEVKFRVKRLPDPVAMIKNSTGGTVSPDYLKDSEGIRAMLTNFDFDAKCEITGYHLVRVGKKEDPVEVINHGSAYNETTRKLIDQAKDGDIYYIDQVTCRCPGDQENRKINSLVLKVKE